MKMKAADKTKWLAALRSGEYAQCAETLSDGNGYCCLGVLETVLSGEVEKDEHGVPLGVPSKEWLDEHGIEVETRTITAYSAHRNNEGKTYYSDHVTEAIGKHFYNVDPDGVFSDLMSMNDEMVQEPDGDGEVYTTNEHANTFKDIAAYIDKHVETY